MVIKRSRGEADATLHITGRDVEERELALRFAASAGTWEVLGPAAEYDLHKTRKTIIDAVREHGDLTPKQLSELTDIKYDLAKTTVWRMANDGQLAAHSGSYSLMSSVTEVTQESNSAWLSQGAGLQSERPFE